MTNLKCLRRAGAVAAAAALLLMLPPGQAKTPAVQLLLNDHGAGNAAVLPTCSTAGPTVSCQSDLVAAVRTLSDTRWQAALAKDVRQVSLSLAAGTYRLDAPLEIQWRSSIPLVITGAEGGGTVISGAAEVPFVPLKPGSEPLGLPAGAHGHIWSAAVPIAAPAAANGFSLPVRPLVGELFAADTRQPVASWPNQGYARLSRPQGVAPDDKVSFLVDGLPSADLSAEPEMRAAGYWFWDWAYQVHPVTAKGGGALSLAGAGSNYGIKPGQRIRLENGLALLDAPGEWVVHAREGRIYWWPGSAAAAGQVTAEWSVVDTALKIKSSQNVTLRGLTVEKFRGDALLVAESSNVLLDGMHLRWIGNRGLIVSGGQKVGLRKSTVEDIGMAAVVLTGGNRTTLQAAGHYAEGNTLRRFGFHNKTYQPGVALNGVGQRVAGNTISDAPHAAILFNGNDHTIADNEIHHVTQETSDAGAIYTGRDFTAQGTVIEGNFIHDIASQVKGLGVVGVYLDDQASGTTIRKNIFARVQTGVLIGGGRDNVVDNNTFYQSPRAIAVDARGITWQKKQTSDPNWGLMRSLEAVPIDSPAWRSRYPRLATIRQDSLGSPKYNRISGNVFVDSGQDGIREEARAGVEVSGSRELTKFELLVQEKSPVLRNYLIGAPR